MKPCRCADCRWARKQIWRWRKALAALILVSLSLSGCMASNATEFVKAMAEYRKAQGEDPRSWCIKATLSTPWGTQNTNVAITGIENGDVTCNQDGLTVRSTPPSVPVGVQIVPTSPTK